MTEQEERVQLAAAAGALTAALAAANGDADQETEACAAAVARFMDIKRARGAAPDVEAAELSCAEFFAEGDREIESAIEAVPDASDEDVQRWWDQLADAAGY